MKKRKIIKRCLCALSVAALMITGIHIPARAETINLSLDDVNENQEFFSKTYSYYGEQQTVFVYNYDGTAKMTGDIIFSTGFGKTECRHIDGYIDIPFEVKDFEVVERASRNPFMDATVEYEMVFVSKNNSVYSFNQPVLSTTYPEDRYTSEDIFSNLNQGESIQGNFVKNGTNVWSFYESIDGILDSSSNINKLLMLDYTTQTVLAENTSGDINSVEVFTKISDNAMKIYPVTIANASFVSNGSVTNFKDVTPSINGTVSTYSFTGLTIDYDSADKSMTITAASGSVLFDAENSKFVTDFGEILVTSKDNDEEIAFVKVLTDKEDIEEGDGTVVTPGHINSTPAWWWTAGFSSHGTFELTQDGSKIGYTFTMGSESASVYIDFETSKVSLYVNGSVTEHNAIIKTDGNAKTFTTDDIVVLAEMPTDLANYISPFSLVYEDGKINSVFSSDYYLTFSGCVEKDMYIDVLTDLNRGDNAFVSAKTSYVSVTGFSESGSALPYSSFFNSILIEDMVYSYDCKDHTYIINDSKELYRVLSTKTGTQSVYLDAEKVADNVVKCAENYYLTSDGKMYSFDGTLVKSGVSNITDATYTIGATTYRLDGTEFLLNYASDYNVKFDTADKSVYEVTYGEDIVSVVAPDGTNLSNGDTYTCLLEGAYLFTVTNTYGDTFTKTLLVSGLDAGLELPGINVLNDTVTLYSDHDIQISDDLNTWTDYTGPIKYEGAFYYRVVTTDKTSDIVKLELVDGKVQTSNVSQAFLSANNFCGLGYIDKNGNLCEFDGYVTEHNVNSAAFYDYSGIGVTTISIFGDIQSYTDLYESKKALKEHGIDDIYKVFVDDVYTYIVGTQGDIVRTKLGETITGSSNMVYAVDWNYEWIGNNYQGISADGTITYGDGQTINVAYSETLDVAFDELKLYTREDLDTYAVGSDLTNVPESNDKIIAVRVVYNGYAALADNGRVYLYDSTVGAMVYDDIVLHGNAIQTDIAQSTSNWTNKAVDLVLSESVNSDAYDKSTLYYKLTNNPTVMGEDFLPYMSSGELMELNITEPTTITYGTGNYDGWANDKYGNLCFIDTGSNCVDAAEIYDKDGNLLEYAPQNDYATYVYNLAPGTYYLGFWYEDVEFSSTYTVNGETFYFADLFKNEILANTESPYIVTDANGNELPTVIKDGKQSVSVTNGKYIIKTIVDGTVMETNTVIINNIDTINPAITYTASNGALSFMATDLEGANSAVSGIDKIYYSTDNVTFTEVSEGAKFAYSKATKDGSTINLNSQYVYMYATDKAGNRSETHTFDLSSVATVVIKTGAPTIAFDNDKTVTVTSSTNIENAEFKYLWVSIDGGEFVRYDVLEKDFILEPGTHTIKSYQTVVALGGSGEVLDSDVTTKTVIVNEPTDEPDDTPENEPTDEPDDNISNPTTGVDGRFLSIFLLSVWIASGAVFMILILTMPEAPKMAKRKGV